MPLFFAGCGISFNSHSGNQNAGDKLKSIDLYLSRASLTRTEFEQFKVSNNRLFIECGKVNGGKQAAEYQKFIDLDSSDLEEIKALSDTVVEFSRTHELMLDKPGSGSSMFDAGQFLLKIQLKDGTNELNTSLNSVTSGSKTALKNLLSLAQKIREIALEESDEMLCTNRRFYEL